jgi:hypothetical protein
MSVSAVTPTPLSSAIAGGAGTPGSSGKANPNQQFASVLQAARSQAQSGQTSGSSATGASLATSEHPHHFHTHGGARSHAASGGTSAGHS